MKNEKRELIGDFIIKVVSGEIDCFSQGIIGIDYEKGIPKLIADPDLQDLSSLEYYQYGLYTDGNKYILIENTEKQDNSGILTKNDFINFIITLQFLIERYVAKNIVKKINKDHIDYKNMMHVLYNTYRRFWQNFINEETINQLAIKDKSLIKYRNYDNLEVPYIFNNDNQIYQAGSNLLIDCNIIFSYYSEVIDNNIYITLMVTRDSVTLHKIIKIDLNAKEFVLGDIQPQLLEFISPMVDTAKEQKDIIKNINQTIERTIEIENKYPNTTELYSKTTNLIIMRDEQCLCFRAIGDFYYKIEIPQSYIHKTDYTKAIKDTIAKFPLVAKLELYRIAETITRGREILYTYLGKEDVSKLSI